MLAPIVLFVYNRIDHTRETVEALTKNMLANESALIIYADAAKSAKDQASVAAVRTYIKGIKGFKSLLIRERLSNYGLSKSVLEGVTEVINEHGKVIVMEDDLISSRYFLTYMNEALNKFETQEKVISVHGYMYPVKAKLPEIFFLRGADCWGWATWKRGWDLLETNGQLLLEKIKAQGSTTRFNFYNSYPFSQMLEDQIAKRNNSWAILWYASAFVKEKLTLYPGSSLLHNIGNDNSGTHSLSTSRYNVKIVHKEVNFNGWNPEFCDNDKAVDAIATYFIKTHSRFGLIKSLLKKYFDWV